MKRKTLFLAAVAIAGCAGKVKPANTSGGPNYSQTPCAENCGNDATCQSSCTGVSNSNMPPGQFGK